MRKVLLIAHDFPPRRTSGIYRPTAFSKHFVGLGWQPTVLTIRTGESDLLDPTLFEKVSPQVNVARTSYLDIAGWDKPARVVQTASGETVPAARVKTPAPIYGLLRRVADFVRACLYFPDETAGWIPAGLEKAIELHLHDRFDLVYSTSPPRSGHVIALMLSKLLGIPWVIEFRDPWKPASRKWRGDLDRRLVARLLRAADAIVTTSKGLADNFEQSHGVPRSKLFSINNGYDETDFARGAAGPSDLLAPGFVHFSHFGTVYPAFSGRFFDALSDLTKEAPGIKDRLRVNVIGSPDAVVTARAREDGLENVVNVVGFINHTRAIQAMQNSDCLLLFRSDREEAGLAVAGKLYEYLRVGRPILAMTHEGETAEILRASQSGWVVDPDDIPAMKIVLRGLVDRGHQANPTQPARADVVARYRWESLAARMVNVFDEVVRRGR